MDNDDFLNIPQSPLEGASQTDKKGKKGDTALKTASVLAFERKLDVSDGLLFSGNWEDRAKKDETQKWSAITVQEKSVRGTISNRLSTKNQDPVKLDAQIENPNLQIVDNAALPWAHDTLKLSFTLRVLPHVGEPSACNNPAYAIRLAEIMAEYKAEQGFDLLAARYAANLANGRFLWRNRIGAEAIEVHVAQMKDGDAHQKWIFDALSHSLVEFTPKEELSALATLIKEGFEGQQHVLLQVEAYVRLGQSQEVFPSQELILNKGKGDKSRTLYVVKDGRQNIAALHSQKIGNALRTIDTWYHNKEENGHRPIAIEPYGSVTTQGRAYRQPKQKSDFYSLLDAWALKDKKPDTEEAQAYVVAMLIRGGVFGDAA